MRRRDAGSSAEGVDKSENEEARESPTKVGDAEQG